MSDIRGCKQESGREDRKESARERAGERETERDRQRESCGSWKLETYQSPIIKCMLSVSLFLVSFLQEEFVCVKTSGLHPPLGQHLKNKLKNKTGQSKTKIACCGPEIRKE